MHGYGNYTPISFLANESKYLDCGQGDWLNPKSEREGSPFNGCSPRKNWRTVYAYDPVDKIDAAYHHLVIGGEVHAWSEQIDHVNMDPVIFPRASAAGEVLWSGAKDSKGAYRSIIAAAPRLGRMRERMVANGFMAEVVQMPFCTMEPNQCDG